MTNYDYSNISTRPKVTIAISVYNDETFLPYAITSVIHQTFQDWELILLNDGSTDDSIHVIRYFEAMDSRIRVVDDSVNKGLIERLNQSVLLARGEFYARMDSDDIIAINRLTEQVEFLTTHPEVDVLGSSAMLIDSDNHIVGSALSEGEVDRFIHPTVMGRTEWFLHHPYSDWARRAEDAELWLRSKPHSRFYALSRPTIFYRQFGVPTCHKYVLTQRTNLRIYKHYRAYHKSLWWMVSHTTVTLFKILICYLCHLTGQMSLFLRLRRWKSVPQNLQLTTNDLQQSIIDLQ